MKKFIVFCLILIVTASLGITVYYFMRDNEALIVNHDAEIFLNVGDTLEIDAEIAHAKIGNEVITTSLNQTVLAKNEVLGCFDAVSGGAAIIEVSAKTGKLGSVYIYVNVGDGSEIAPYYIDSEEDLLKIGEGNFTANSHYILTQDISLSGEISPLLNGTQFAGSLDGNGFTISNLTIRTQEGVKDAGLFSQISSTGKISNLTLTNISVNGQFESAGAFAGVNYGTITRCEAQNGIVISTVGDSIAGGIAGKTIYAGSNVGRIDRCSSTIAVSASKYVGGLTGVNEGGIIINSYVRHFESDNSAITGTHNGAVVGGLVGLHKNKQDSQIAIIKNCYFVGEVVGATLAENVTIGTLIGYNDEESNLIANYIMGVYTNNTTYETANHEFNRTFAQNEQASAKNYRGLYNTIPTDAEGNVIVNELVSYVSKVLDNENIVYWDFTNVWEVSASVNDGYPTLNKYGPNVADDISIAYNENVIRTVQDLMNAAQAVNRGDGLSYYVLGNDIDLTNTDYIPMGTSENPFNGIFDGNGFTITGLTVKTTTINQMTGTKYAGLFGRISVTALIKNVKLQNVTIQNGATYAGALVGYSEGQISNVVISQTSLNKEVTNITGVYAVGGLAGYSNGIIDNCKVVNQTIVTTASDNASNRFGGGLVGINGSSIGGTTATITNSSTVTSYVYDAEVTGDYPNGFIDKYYNTTNYYQTVIGNADAAHIGGIAGANYHLITKNYVYNSHLKVDNYNTDNVVAGITGLSKSTTLLNSGKAEISYNKVYGEGMVIEGFIAAGLVNHLYGIAQFNHVEVHTISGFIIAGLTTDIKLNANLNNCYSKSHLQNISDIGCTAGMTNCVRYSGSQFGSESKNVYGRFSQIFSACTFEGSRLDNTRYDSNAQYRVENNWLYKRIDGWGNHLIWVETGNAEYDNEWWYMTEINNVYGISETDGTLNTNEEKVRSIFTSNGFNGNDWLLEVMVGPSLNGLPEIAELN